MDPIFLLWKQAPFIRLLLPFATGIGLKLTFPSLSGFIALIAAVVFAIALALLHRRFPGHRQVLLWRGVSLMGLLASAGFGLSALRQTEAPALDSVPQAALYLLRCRDQPDPKTRSYRAEMDVVWGPKETGQRMIVYLSKGDKAARLRPGDHMLAKIKPEAMRSSGNPGSFDYAAWCRRKGITHSAFLPEAQWEIVQGFPSSLINLQEANRKTRGILCSHLPDSATHGLAEALLVGFRGHVQQDLWNDYARTGIAHIIAISGMHLAMVYRSMRWLLTRIPRWRSRTRPAIAGALLFMWGFALLTGLPASVCRAAFMFTLIAWGEWKDKKMSVFNNLAASAFLLLCWQPMWLADAGFQLSYLAVLSLVIFYQPIYRSVYVPWKIPDLVWQLLAGTIAAQILTLPICLYYFRQFPVLFLLSNLVAVPLSTLILYLEIATVCLHPFTALADATGRICSLLISWLNAAVKTIGQSRLAVLDDVVPDALQAVLLGFLIVCVAHTVMRRSAWGFLWGLASATLLGVSVLFNRVDHLQQHSLWILQQPRQSVLLAVAGTRGQFLGGDSLSENNMGERMLRKPVRQALGIRSETNLILQAEVPGGRWISFGGLSVLWWEGKRWPDWRGEPLKVDYLLLGRNYRPGGKGCTCVQPRHIVLDSGWPAYRAREMKQHLESAWRAPVEALSLRGAMSLQLKP